MSNSERFLAKYGPSEAIDAAQKSDDISIRAAAATNPCASKHQLDKAMVDHNEHVVMSALSNSSCSLEHIGKGLNHTSLEVRLAAIDSPNISKEQLLNALQNDNENVRYNAQSVLDKERTNN